jgi:hypothetical protein
MKDLREVSEPWPKRCELSRLSGQRLDMLNVAQERQALGHHEFVRNDGAICIGLVIQGLGLPRRHRQGSHICKVLASVLVVKHACRAQVDEEPGRNDGKEEHAQQKHRASWGLTHQWLSSL